MKKLIHPIIFLQLVMLTVAPLYSQESVFATGIENQRKLPLPSVTIDDESLAQAYLSRKVFTAEQHFDDQSYNSYYSSAFREDEKVNDARNMLTRYFNHNLFDIGNPGKGFAELDVSYYDYQFDAAVGFVLNVITFGVGNLLGIPNFKSRAVVEVELVFYDEESRPVAAYTGTGTKKCYQGLYYPDREERQVHILCMKEALKGMNEQIMKDYDRLAGLLAE